MSSSTEASDDFRMIQTKRTRSRMQLHFDGDGPPFGGSIDEYIDLFKGVFKEIVIDEEPASIKPRKGREVFMLGRK